METQVTISYICLSIGNILISNLPNSNILNGKILIGDILKDNMGHNKLNMGRSPFIYGSTVSQVAYTNREEQYKKLYGNLTQGINTMLISPRRWGKSSLGHL
jgi:hypothetical protein